MREIPHPKGDPEGIDYFLTANEVKNMIHSYLRSQGKSVSEKYSMEYHLMGTTGALQIRFQSGLWD